MKSKQTRSVCVIQHSAAEPAGLLAQVLEEEGWDLRVIRTYRHEAIPDRLDSDRGLVILGGPMSANDRERCPFLEQERKLLAGVLAQPLPVLGICLGSQLLAAALGSTVVPNTRREFGWHEVRFRKAAASDPLWQGLTGNLTAFHWHTDRFELPEGAVSLAWSDRTDCQSFRWGKSAYGILFHLESDQRHVERMTRAFQAELFDTDQHPDDIVGAAPEYLPKVERVGREIFRRWAKMLG
ncbi:MAG: type 1 glutamine amidotransferase [Verrucomicrobiales bacterium]|nr:type 1 glutamine amidotransferase [Verrucomicrobiales bacterium]